MLSLRQSNLTQARDTLAATDPTTGRRASQSKTFMEYTDPAIRLTLLPRDTNPQGTIFGGIILSYIDIAGAVEAHRRTQIERFVTVAMREVIFHQPVFVGDLVSFYASTARVGTTSITIRVVVEAERYGGTSERIKVTEAEVVYVAVDANRRKMKINRDLIKGDASGIEQHETS
ncbi:MAG TPA: hotdog domain-containing protein [Pyrinomonadaceae bacterium]